MKSNVTSSHGFDGGGRGDNLPNGLCRAAVALRHFKQSLQYSAVSLEIPFHVQCLWSFSSVFLDPKWPAIGLWWHSSSAFAFSAVELSLNFPS